MAHQGTKEIHFEEIKNSLNPKPVGTTRSSLPKRKRVHSLRKHREEMIAHFKKLNQEVEAQKEIIDDLRMKMNLDTHKEF